MKEVPDHEYHDLEKAIRRSLKEEIGVKKFWVKTKKEKESQETKLSRKRRNEKKKKYEEAIKEDRDHQTELKEYIEAQKNLRNVIEEDERQEIERKLDKMIQAGGSRSTNFWRERKKIVKEEEEEENLVTEDGVYITEENEYREYIAK